MEVINVIFFLLRINEIYQRDRIALLNREKDVEECDATGDAMENKSRAHNNFILINYPLLSHSSPHCHDLLLSTDPLPLQWREW